MQVLRRKSVNLEAVVLNRNRNELVMVLDVDRGRGGDVNRVRTSSRQISGSGDRKGDRILSALELPHLDKVTIGGATSG